MAPALPPTSERPPRAPARAAFRALSWLLPIAWCAGLIGVAVCYVVGVPRRHVTVSDAPAEGPVIARGWLDNDDLHVSPGGWYAAAWSAHADGPWMGSGTADCDLAESEGLTLADSRGSLRVDPRFVRGDKHEYFQPKIDEAFDFTPSAEPPEAFIDRCARRFDGAIPTKAEAFAGHHKLKSYRELVLPRGTIVEISGCRVGDALIPCDDGDDGIFIPPNGPGEDRLHATRRHDRAVILEGLEWMGAVLLALGGLWLWLGHRAGVLGGIHPKPTRSEVAG